MKNKRKKKKYELIAYLVKISWFFISKYSYVSLFLANLHKIYSAYLQLAKWRESAKKKNSGSQLYKTMCFWCVCLRWILRKSEENEINEKQNRKYNVEFITRRQCDETDKTCKAHIHIKHYTILWKRRKYLLKKKKRLHIRESDFNSIFIWFVWKIKAADVSDVIEKSYV